MCSSSLERATRTAATGGAMIFQSQANLGSLLMIDAICSACLVISYHDESMLQSPHPVKTFCAAIERGVCDNESCSVSLV